MDQVGTGQEKEKSRSVAAHPALLHGPFLDPHGPSSCGLQALEGQLSSTCLQPGGVLLRLCCGKVRGMVDSPGRGYPGRALASRARANLLGSHISSLPPALPDALRGKDALNTYVVKDQRASSVRYDNRA